MSRSSLDDVAGAFLPPAAPTAIELNGESAWAEFQRLQAAEEDRYATTAVSSEMPDALETDIRPFAATLPVAPILKAAASDQVGAVKLTVEAVMLISRRNGRVCPRPDAWLQLYELLPAKRARGPVWQPTPPVAAPAWQACSEVSKRLVLREHVEWAARRGALPALHAFLVALPETSWHHMGEG